MIRPNEPTSASGHERRIRANAPAAGRPKTADPAGGQGGFRLGPGPAASPLPGISVIGVVFFEPKVF